MKKHIIFMCNNQKTAVDIDVTERILLLEDITLIPDTSNYIKGVIDYSEEVLPVIDLNERLFHQTYQKTEQTKVIVTLWKNKKIGLIVDDVTAVQDFSDQELQSDTNENKGRSISAIVRTPESIITVIDVDNLFSADGEAELLSIIETFAKEKESSSEKE
ncbi:MAG: chemotaxis protein CheW [Desemzia incerta]|uniref:chemotaxis protein CheW n=1 Tax=Desemzia incerta TaxID=82801 RepID=UPI003315AD36